MYLKKIQVQNSEVIVKIEFEKIAVDLIIISVNYDVDTSSVIPSYWRLLGDGMNPPLEIGINTVNKTIKSITVFVDADCFSEMDLENPDTLFGNILVDVDIFKKANDYVDTVGKYFMKMSGNTLTCVFGLHNNIKEAIGNERIRLFFNYNDELCGFEINHLSDSEIQYIMTIK